MEQKLKSSNNRWKLALIIPGTLLLAFIIYFTIMSMIAPVKKLKEINQEYGIKNDEKNVSDIRLHSDSLYLALLKDKTFLQSRIAMAETDSIYLTINLADTTANIEISGVAVHSVKMHDVEVSKILLHGDENIILAMLALPFTISSNIATIKKEPVLIKMAPKDTSEYKPDIMPDTSITEPVNYMFQMTNGLRIYVYQSESEKYEDRMGRFRFDLDDRLENLKQSLKHVLIFEVPEYHPFIRLKIPRDDAKIIYRAIPRYGQVGIYKQ